MRRRGFIRALGAAVGAVACKALPRGHEPKAIEGEVLRTFTPPADDDLIWAVNPGAYLATVFYGLSGNRWTKTRR